MLQDTRHLRHSLLLKQRCGSPNMGKFAASRQGDVRPNFIEKAIQLAPAARRAPVVAATRSPDLYATHAAVAPVVSAAADPSHIFDHGGIDNRCLKGRWRNGRGVRAR